MHTIRYPQYNYRVVAEVICKSCGLPSVTFEQVEYYIGMRLEFGLTILP